MKKKKPIRRKRHEHHQRFAGARIEIERLLAIIVQLEQDKEALLRLMPHYSAIAELFIQDRRYTLEDDDAGR